MAHSGFFDRTGDGLIQALRSIGSILVCALVIAACTKTAEPPVDAGATQEPVLDAGQVTGADEAAGADPSVTAVADPNATGIFEREGGRVAQAVGVAPKSVDIGLARSRAANRARANLLTLLKENGLAPADGHRLAGATIERTWTEGNRLYALAVLTLENQPGEMNETPPAASKSTGDAPTGTAGQPEGAVK